MECYFAINIYILSISQPQKLDSFYPKLTYMPLLSYRFLCLIIKKNSTLRNCRSAQLKSADLDGLHKMFVSKDHLAN